MAQASFRGELIKWNDERGFGFIRPDADAKDQIFLHIKEVRRATRRPVEGDIVTFSLKRQPDGKMRAYDAEIQGAIRPPRSTPKSLPIAVAALICFGASTYLAMRTGFLIILAFYPLMSVFSMIAYLGDKDLAERDEWRISEATLLMFDLFGGWPGGALAQYALRHKVMKPSFQNSFRGITVLHSIVWIALVVASLFNFEIPIPILN
jgi:uncharacterized membrane protein YsdA (DUF1294 family)/cold shock CspA family protein